MDEKFYITTDILNTLKAKNELAKFFKKFIVKLTDYKGLDFIELFDYKCKYNKEELSYDIYCKVASSRYINLPTTHLHFLINDYNCFLLDKNKKISLTKFWQNYCLVNLNPDLLELWQKGKDQKSYYNVYNPIKRC